MFLHISLFYIYDRIVCYCFKYALSKNDWLSVALILCQLQEQKVAVIHSLVEVKLLWIVLLLVPWMTLSYRYNDRRINTNTFYCDGTVSFLSWNRCCCLRSFLICFTCFFFSYKMCRLVVDFAVLSLFDDAFSPCYDTWCKRLLHPIIFFSR